MNKRLKDFVNVRNETISPNFSGDILYVDISSVSQEKGIVKKTIMKSSEAPSRAKKIVRHNDVIISNVRTYLKSIALVEKPEENLIVSTGFSVLKPKSHCNPLFLSYLLKNNFFHNQVMKKSKGVSYPAINTGDLLEIECSIDFKNQEKIVDFLDAQCSKIDTEVDLLEKKSNLLDEYKNALIYETVTKGLNKNSEMKDSGVEWIGEIPSKWQVKRVKEISKYMTGFTPSTSNDSFYDGLDKWITIGDMNGKYIKESKKTINGSLFNQTWKTPKNSLLFSFKLSIGQVAFNDTPVFTNEAICSFLRSSKINLDYFYYAAPIFIVKNAKKNIFNADLLNQDLIANAVCLFPSSKEQVEIAEYLDKETQNIEKQLELIKKKVELLKEYKQSLIYEAVTGQLEIE